MSELYPVLRALKMGPSGGGGGGGFTPTEEQLTAMNSGIDSEKVAQIGTNETNISLLQGDVAENENNISTLQQQVGYANTELEGVL